MDQIRAAAPAARSLCVAIDGANLTADGLRIFADFSLDLPIGQWTCLLGPSGIGKTTLLRAVAGFLPPAPSIVLQDAPWQARGQIAYMAQQDLLLPWLSALDNVLLGARLRGEKNRHHLDGLRLLDQVGLASRADALPQTLSGGMRQRVALARTLFEQRMLVLMDEPFSQLDALSRIEMQDLARRLLAGRTVLLVTHDPLEALRLGDRIVVLNGAPASASAPILLPSSPPRDLAAADIAQRYGEIMAMLRPMAQGAAA